MSESPKPLTKSQIKDLPEELHPGYVGEDENGRYKVDQFGDKKRPFEKGGPSPNPDGAPRRSAKLTPDQMLDQNNWIDPFEFYMAIMNCDIKTINRTRRGQGDDNKIKKSSISFRDQMEAASKVLPYFMKQIQTTTTPSPPSPEAEDDESPRAVLAAPGGGRRKLLE